MDQNLKVELTLLYYIQQERLNNEIVEKIIWNDALNSQLDSLLFNDDEIEVLGLYGTLESVCEYLQERIGLGIEASQDIINQSERGIIAFTKYQKDFFLMYIGPESYFIKDKFEESAEITVYRYLKDLCQKIVLLPSKKIIEQWKNLNNHYYQDQDSIVQEFEIKKVDEASLDIEKLQITVKSEDINNLQRLIDGQGNLRCVNHNILKLQYKQLNENQIKNYFQQIIAQSHFDIQTLDLDQYQQQLQYQIRLRFKDYQMIINNIMSELYKDSYNKIKGWDINIFRSNLKKNHQIFEVVHNVIFEMIRQQLSTIGISYLDNYKMEKEVINKINELRLTNAEILQQCSSDLQHIISDYMKQFNSLFEYRNNNSIPQLWRQIWQQIQSDSQDFRVKQEYKLLYQLYEFKIINSLKDASQFIVMDQLFSQQLELQELKNINPEKLVIKYYFTTSDFKHPQLLLLNNNQGSFEYIWVTITNQQMQETFRITQNNSQLKFFYNMQNTTMYVFNTKIGISIIQYNEDRKVIKSEKNIPNKLEITFIDICYLPFFETFILLSHKHSLYKWHIDTKDFVQITIQSPSQSPLQQCRKLLTSGYGNYYCMANQVRLDFVNFNNQVVKTIQFHECFKIQKINIQNIQLFSDTQDWYLVYIDKNNSQVFQIKNLSNLQKIVSKKLVNTDINFTNSYLDLIKGSLIKYGPSNNIFETTPYKTQLYIKNEIYNILESYIKLLDLQHSDDLIILADVNDVIGHQILSRSLGFIILSRTSIQICTVDKQQLIPLSNGSEQKNHQNQIRILDKVNNLSFGILEKLLCMQDNKNIFIVSIMGRQSSGKSYLLNRIFGTRFGVSSARCTDGIWMSISKIENITFVILDCEGLFSTRRTQDEETMLLAFLSSISDITILNQDLTFSRNLNELFQNLSKSIEQIRGDKLFKGKLMIAVRDVNQKEKDSAQKELIKNIDIIKNNQLTGNFLTLLFNDQFQTILMSYFDNKQFEKDILQMRSEFLQNAINLERWDNPQQLIRSMKIMLIQIEVKDHRSLEDHELEFIIKNLIRKTKDYWMQLKQEELPELDLFDSSTAYQILLNYSIERLSITNDTLNFNNKLMQAEKIIQQVLKNRLEETLLYLQQDLQTKSINKINDEKIQKAIKEVRQNLQDNAGQYMICLQKCSQCFLFCTLRKDHLERDQLIHKDLLQDDLIQIENKIIQKKLKLQTFEDIEDIQNKIQINKIKQIEVQDLLQLKQNILDYEQKILEIQNCLRCQDYKTDNFEQSIQNHLNKSLKSINLEDFQEVTKEDVEYIDNLLCSNDNQLQQIIHQKQEENQKLLSLEEKLKQINNCNLIQERNQLTNKMGSLINQTTLDHQELENCQNQSISLKSEIQNLNEEYQTIVDKYVDINICEKIQQQKQQLKQQEGNLEKIKNQIQQKTKEIQIQLKKQGIENYLEIEIEKIEENAQDIENKIKFKQSRQSQRNQQKQELQNKLEGNKVEKKEIEKINTKLIQIEKDINNFNKEIQLQENQSKLQNYYLKKLQNLQQNYLDQEQLDDQIDQIEETSIQIVQIFNINLFSEQEFVELKILDMNNVLDELIIIEKLNLLQSQDVQNQDKIKNLDQNIINNQTLLDNTHIQLELLNKKILENDEQEQNSHQQLVIIQENQKNYEQQEKQFNDIGNQLIKIKNEIILAKQLNQQLIKLQDIINNQSTGRDMNILESNTLNALQVQASQINLQLNDLMDNFENMINYNELQNEKLIKQRELEDIEQYLSKQHTCGRSSHQCDQICQCCNDPLTMCQYQAGHSNEKESHLCSNNSHYCKQQCQVKNCDSFCQYQFNHSSELNHLCSGQHDCLELCSFCPKRCKQSSLNDHTIHQCEQIKCTKLCYFNLNYFNEDKKCINNCNNLHNEIHDHHICSNSAHQCQNKCEQKGICQISTYTEIIKEWTTQNGSKFPYKIYKQNSEIMQCQQKVEQQQIIHDGVHQCNEYHICDQRCPECSAFCTLKIGHEGKHQPHLHRNKEQQIFTALEGSDQEKLQIQEEGQTREYYIGESCEPETCLISCSRRSRAHYHLLECKGGKECTELLLNEFGIVAKHQTSKYKGSDKIYDEILCEAYWDYLGWEHPVESKQRNEISLCNYYCNSCKGPEQQFCIQEAWHTESSQYQDHIFICSDKHKMNGLDICFVIDTTSSMDTYIEMVKNLINKLMKSTKKYHEKNKKVLRLAIISYKDHCDPQVVKSVNFTSYDTAIQFLINLKARGGGDAPEAMFDGLLEATNLDWSEKSKRFVFLVADSPPHGQPKFHNFKDSHPKGCPCGIDEYKVLNRFKDLNIELFMLKLNSHLDQTIGVFKKIMPTITVLETVSKQEFINHIDQLICTELDIREVTLTRQK